MRIQHNIMAMNAYRNYTGNTSALSKNLEKLSSGYKINRAGDDAAGLAISEKMRAQVTGLKAAQKNAKDGISLVQTAEGALTEVHSMLNRMVDLADQSANGTFDDGTDRANLQKEFDALRSEIDRISKATNFNGKALLDGKMGVAATITTTAGENVIPDPAGTPGTKYSNNMTLAGTGGTPTVATDDTIELAYTGADGTSKTFTITAAGAADHAAGAVTTAELEAAVKGGDGLKGLIDTLAAAGNAGATAFKATFNVTASSATEFKVEATAADADIEITSITTTLATPGGSTTYALGTGADAVVGADPTGTPTPATGAETVLDFTGKTGTDVMGSTIEVGGKIYEFVATGAAATGTNTAVELGAAATANDIATALKAKVDTDTGLVDNGGTTAGEFATTAANGKLTFTSHNTGSTAVAASVKQTGGLTLQIGDTSDGFNQISVSVGNMDSVSLGIDSTKINISSQKGAAAAVKVIKDAINSVSSTRGDLGAVQNRLEHTINNLSVMTENIQDAEANIRDVDVAEEMMAYTKNNILVQSAQAMLAQANQLPQGVLQLLQ